MERFYIGKIGVNIANMPAVLSKIEKAIENKHYGYICITNSRVVYKANHDNDYLMIQNNSLMTLPDGVPLIWVANNLGYKDVHKVSGPDLFLAVLELSKHKGYSHFFYGSTPETIQRIDERMRKDYPNVEVKGANSPPFQPIEDFNVKQIAAELNRLKPTFFWCGLGAPKQEQLIASLQPKLDATICIGVGLAFNYFAGSVKRAPKWMQSSGLEGVFRLIQQPKFIKRAVIPLSWIMMQAIKTKFGRKTHK